PKLDLAGMLAFKDQGVKGNVDGVAFLLKKNKVDVFHGAGSLNGRGKVKVALNGGDSENLEASSIVIATGSDVAKLPGIEIDEQTVVSSTGALSLLQVPKRLLIIGAGVIGLELGSVWRRLGSEVLTVEYLDRILPGTDAEVARALQRLLMKQGMSFKLASKVTGIARNGAQQKVTIEPATGGAPIGVEADVVLVAVGRVPFTDGLGLEAAGVQLDNKRRVVVDARYQTNVAGIYAIGDVIAGPMLAHKAEDEGIAVAETLAGQSGHVNYDAIPNVIYTFPEVATVGRSEEDLKAANVAYKVGKFPFTANARAKVNKTTDGFVKILADAGNDRILGVHIIAAAASEMIAEATAIIEFGGSAEDLARTCHAHPTLTEAVKEAALAVDKRAIHI
ncbi:MAG TPA: dihydrolipoyl dehydrogenase, partial [Hyphomicrobiaceae bacterium]|nr:dihydrolipoyl dehydrogenase [Hyphomicrobiaceae bacterium]